MAETREFNNFKDAFERLIPEGKGYILTPHTLSRGDNIKLHHHPKATEWLIINHGKFTVTFEGEKQEFKLDRRVVAIKFPAGKNHSLEVFSKVSYFVLRDRKDKTIYVEEGQK